MWVLLGLSKTQEEMPGFFAFDIKRTQFLMLDILCMG